MASTNTIKPPSPLFSGTITDSIGRKMTFVDGVHVPGVQAQAQTPKPLLSGQSPAKTSPTPQRPAANPTKPQDSKPPKPKIGSYGAVTPQQSQLLSSVAKKAQAADFADPMGNGKDVIVDNWNLPPDILHQFDAHGPQTIARLAHVLNNGIDKNKTDSNGRKTWFSEQLGADKSAKLLRDGGPFLILSHPGKTLADGGVGGVVVDDHHATALPELRAAFPSVKFISSKDAPTILPKVAPKNGKPVQYKSMRVRQTDSPLGRSPFFRKKSASDWSRQQGPSGGVFWVSNKNPNDKRYQDANPGGEGGPAQQPQTGEDKVAQQQTPEARAESYATQLRQKFGDKAGAELDKIEARVQGDQAKMNAVKLVREKLGATEKPTAIAVADQPAKEDGGKTSARAVGRKAGEMLLDKFGDKAGEELVKFRDAASREGDATKLKVAKFAAEEIKNKLRTDAKQTAAGVHESISQMREDMAKDHAKNSEQLQGAFNKEVDRVRSDRDEKVQAIRENFKKKWGYYPGEKQAVANQTATPAATKAADVTPTSAVSAKLDELMKRPASDPRILEDADALKPELAKIPLKDLRELGRKYYAIGGTKAQLVEAIARAPKARAEFHANANIQIIKSPFAQKSLTTRIDSRGNQRYYLNGHRIASTALQRQQATPEAESDPDMGDDRKKFELIAEIIGGIYQDRALKVLGVHSPFKSLFRSPFLRRKALAIIFKAWDALAHPRGKNGRFIPKGSGEAVSTAKDAIKATLKGPKTPETATKLLEHLNLLTVKQLQEIKKEYQLSASGENKAALTAKIAERLGKGRTETPEGESPSWEIGEDAGSMADEEGGGGNAGDFEFGAGGVKPEPAAKPAEAGATDKAKPAPSSPIRTPFQKPTKIPPTGVDNPAGAGKIPSESKPTTEGGGKMETAQAISATSEGGIYGSHIDPGLATNDDVNTRLEELYARGASVSKENAKKEIATSMKFYQKMKADGDNEYASKMLGRTLHLANKVGVTPEDVFGPDHPQLAEIKRMMRDATKPLHAI